MILMLSACSSDDVAQAVNDILANETATVSGVVIRGSTPESGVTVKGNYRDSTIPAATTTTNANGEYTLTVVKNIPVSIQISKPGSDVAIFNAAYFAADVNVSGIDFDVITSADVDSAIDPVFPGLTLGGGQAWLAVMVMDASDNDIDGATITTTADPANLADEAATTCTGLNSGDVVTIGNCVPGRDGPMYLAYFSAENEVSVSVTGSTEPEIAPVRVGEVTVVEVVQ